MLDLPNIFAPLRAALPGHDERITAWQAEASTWIEPDLTAIQGRPLFVSGEGLPRQWDFGDSTSRFNVLPGYNAAHIYDMPGTYLLTRTDPDGANTRRKTIRVQPATTATTSVPAGADLFAAVSTAKSDTILQLQRGVTYDLHRTIRVSTPRLSILATPGDNAPPRVRMVAATKTYAFFITSGADLLVDGIEFDSDVPLQPNPAKIDRHAFYIENGSLAVRNSLARNLDNFVQGSPGAIGVLIQDCHATRELRSCFAWIDGTDYVLLGNSATDSYCEHIVRTAEPAVQRILVFGNDFANPPARTKETLTFRNGRFLYAARNTLRFGWVQVSQGTPQPTTQAQHVILRDNTLTDGAWFEIKPACDDVLVSGNTIQDTGGVDNPVHATGNCRARIENNLWKRRQPTARAFVARFPVASTPPLIPDVTESGNQVIVQP